MSTLATSTEVNVPVRTAYNQWTQFEEFPKFMDGVIEVRQLNDRHVHWKAILGGLEREWDAKSMVRLHIAYDPQGIVETIGDEMGTVSTYVKEDLKRFKNFIEAQGKETGAWRGKI